MPSSPPFLSKRWARDAASGRDTLAKVVAAVPHLAALGIMIVTEEGFERRLAFLLTWILLNCLWLALLRRPGLSGAVSLGIIVVLVLLSELKYQVVSMTVSFVDVMLIDRDTIAFLFTIFPGLQPIVLVALAAAVPVVVLLWRVDPFRVPRPFTAAAAFGSVAGLIGISHAVPLEQYETFFGQYHVSGFARSSVDAISDLIVHGFMESDPVAADRLKSIDFACQPAGKPPHIILVHDESSFDIRPVPGIKVPPGYGAHFLSFDGKERNFIVEGAGGPSWYTEYNVLAGLSARTFGRFAYFVTRIAAGRVERGLPQALRRCGYRTFSLYPARGGFMSAGAFQKTVGVENFYDSVAMGSDDLERDKFYYDAAARIIERQRAGGPMFVYVYLAANHFPWDFRWRPDLMTNWQNTGNAPEIDEYLRRQTLGMQEYADFLARLKRDFAGESFLLVRYGDHQPDFASQILEPGIDEAVLARRLLTHDRRYFTTYYAIDAVNFEPVNTSSALDALEGPYLPLVIEESAGLPLDPSFAEQKKILARCHGLFYDCGAGAEARRFNRLLIDAGLIKGL